MSSLYLRGSIWWAMSYEQGKMIRWRLGTSDKREARPRLREFDSQPRKEPLPTRLKSPATWDTAAQELLAYYLAYGTRRVHEAERQVRTLKPVLHRMDAHGHRCGSYPGICGTSEGRGEGRRYGEPGTGNASQGAQGCPRAREARRAAVIHMLRPATPRSGFFEREQFEAVSRELPPDIRVVVLIGYTYGWMITKRGPPDNLATGGPGGRDLAA